MNHDHLVRWNRWILWEGIHQGDLAVTNCRGRRSAPLAFPDPGRFLAGRDAWKDRDCISGEVVSVSHRRKAERLEYEQQRELWDWNTMKPTGVFGIVWE